MRFHLVFVTIVTAVSKAVADVTWYTNRSTFRNEAKTDSDGKTYTEVGFDFNAFPMAGLDYIGPLPSTGFKFGDFEVRTPTTYVVQNDQNPEIDATSVDGTKFVHTIINSDSELVFDFGASVVYAFGFEYRIFDLGALVEVVINGQAKTFPLNTLNSRAFVGFVSETGISRIVVKENPLNLLSSSLRFNFDNVIFFVLGQSCRRRFLFICKD